MKFQGTLLQNPATRQISESTAATPHWKDQPTGSQTETNVDKVSDPANPDTSIARLGQAARTYRKSLCL